MGSPDPIDPRPPPIKIPVTTGATGSTPAQENVARCHQFLRKIFDGGLPPLAYPNACFYIDQNEVDEEKAEMNATNILIHYHSITAFLENGISSKGCALSNKAWLQLHNDIFVRMIHGIARSFASNPNADICTTLLPGELDILNQLHNNVRMVATAFTSFPINVNQCDNCLRHVNDPFVSENEFLSILHATNHSRQVLKDHLWEESLQQIQEELRNKAKQEYQAHAIVAKAKLHDHLAQFRTDKGAELNDQAEKYFASRQQAMLQTIELTIQQKQETLLCQHGTEDPQPHPSPTTATAHAADTPTNPPFATTATPAPPPVSA